MTIPYTFVPGTPILSAQVNANFAACALTKLQRAWRSAMWPVFCTYNGSTYGWVY